MNLNNIQQVYLKNKKKEHLTFLKNLMQLERLKKYILKIIAVE